MLVAGRDIRILDDHTGELPRQLTLDPTRDYQPKPEGDVYDVSTHDMRVRGATRPLRTRSPTRGSLNLG